MTEYVATRELEGLLDKFSIKLTQHIDKQIDELRGDIASIDKKYDHLITTLDTFLKRLDDIETDNHARDAQIARLERWIEQVAAKTGVKLEY